ncbi:MAG: bifunctional 23S rRNA (guanine(2069)-N(7))-methyltransferase RlmK/23S rRNA (guanine(2445)-N(2))-methyltransferase RlmL [Deltaproteobacteria bacterium]|nr:bifunctional 23S rRNA (guanine(2069)-N(7))-methyltransferase RlmK/23S rRNA (guanine(2445)-N(2))-methyltransferase RlmL [Deltaproteobacteria bacterium]
MPSSYDLFATAPRGMESLLADELRAIGAPEVSVRRAGVALRGTLELGLRCCLWSRVASRVLLEIASFEADSPDALYRGVRDIDWNTHLGPDQTFAVDFSQARSPMTHTLFAALRVKDGIADQFRAVHGRRPSVDLERPDLRLHVHAEATAITVYVDLSGGSLHRRGYRTEAGEAPLRENLAAALLLRARWPEVAATGQPLLDPMCGSGTFAIEAALMAAGIAPGLCRAHHGCVGWRQHDAAAWSRLLAEATAQREQAHCRAPIIGSDLDAAAVRIAIANAQRAGVSQLVHFERRDLSCCHELLGRRAGPGIVVVNPPYGERLGQRDALRPLYATLGATLREHFSGWRAYVLASDDALTRALRLRATRRWHVFNGAIECRWLELPIADAAERARRDAAASAHGAAAAARDGYAVEAFANRLAKRDRALGRWARREAISCYRVYDADIPAYAVAIDRYEQWVNVQEYQPPRSIDEECSQRRRQAILEALPRVLEVPADHIFFKTRHRQRPGEQYQRLDRRSEFHVVREGGLEFLVNFTDHLDTGLFLDGRLTRRLIRELADGRRFLNLFCYTATATVCAARGGAVDTTSVDLSNTYLDWAGRNLERNGVRGRRHQLVRADCVRWLAQQRGRYDLIFVEPPTFSSSKRTGSVLDLQRDHGALIGAALRLLAPDGVLLFSTNFRRFKLDREALGDAAAEDLSGQTLPLDFKRSARLHHVWRIALTGNRGARPTSA